MLELERVTVRFGGVIAVNALSLSIATNAVTGLVGPNGAGKTTLFNAISGLVRPSDGSITFNAVDVLRAPVFRRARLGLGRTFQVPQPLSRLTVMENLLVAQRFGSGAVNESRLDEILEFVGLAEKSGHDAASELALSELKALEVGKALATNPSLLLLDEVLAGLETTGKRRFMQMLKDMHVKFGVGILVIEHDIETISNLCKRVVVLNFGELIADGSPDEVFRDPAVIKSYTGGGDA